MAFKKVAKTEWGTIGIDKERGGKFYLRFAYRGKDFARSLDCTSLSVAHRKASRTRRDAEEEHLKSLSQTVPEQPKEIRLTDDISGKMIPPDKLKDGEDPGYNGYLETFYPLDTTRLSTHYDNEKLLKLFFGRLAFILGKTFDELTLKDLKKEWMVAAYNEIKKKYSKKVQQKVAFSLNKFIFWEIKSKRILAETDLMEEIKKNMPSNAEVIKLRQRALENEIWTDD